ncbi:alpha/beta hydrolase [Aeromicrobium sp.]|uniref:alpha/beta fold hydrolase n=1 Tax=Aeromicrobium sp. TaxID=1871063 RepID=UPI0028B25992|nr:alpha/beta hydrolase [Aeromicrobium sp.]
MEFVETAGLTIAYHRVGEGPALLFVHGAAEDGRVWAPQFAGLSDEFTVIAWDEPGAGQSSDLPGHVDLADFADGLAAVIGALDLGPVHLAGLSWGGTVMLELYRRHPSLVATLIFIDSYAGWRGSLPVEEVDARVAGTRRMLADGEPFDPTLPGLFAHGPPARFVSLLAEIASSVRPSTLGIELGIMAEADLSNVLPRITVPTLLVWGREDARSPLFVARQFHEAIADSSLVVIDDAGHMSHLERPEQVNAAIREFCRAHAAQTRVTIRSDSSHRRRPSSPS